MTTMSEIELECCICGEKNNHMVIGSINTFGYKNYQWDIFWGKDSG